MSIILRKQVRPFLIMLIPIFFAWLGFSVGKQMVVAYYDGAFVEWAMLESPPASLSNILFLSYAQSEVVVETEAGAIFQGDLELCQQSAGCWTEIVADDLVEEPEMVIGGQCTSTFAAMEAPPQPVVQCASLTVEGADLFDELHLALLADDSLWLWRFRGGSLSVPFLSAGFLFAGFTAVLGLIVGIMVTVLLRKRKVG